MGTTALEQREKYRYSGDGDEAGTIALVSYRGDKTTTTTKYTAFSTFWKMTFNSRPARAGSKNVTRYLPGRTGVGLSSFRLLETRTPLTDSDGWWHVRYPNTCGRANPSAGSASRLLLSLCATRCYASVNPRARARGSQPPRQRRIQEEFRPPDSSPFARVRWPDFDFFTAVFT